MWLCTYRYNTIIFSRGRGICLYTPLGVWGLCVCVCLVCMCVCVCVAGQPWEWDWVFIQWAGSQCMTALLCGPCSSLKGRFLYFTVLWRSLLWAEALPSKRPQRSPLPRLKKSHYVIKNQFHYLNKLTHISLSSFCSPKKSKHSWKSWGTAKRI